MNTYEMWVVSGASIVAGVVWIVLFAAILIPTFGDKVVRFLRSLVR